MFDRLPPQPRIVRRRRRRFAKCGPGAPVRSNARLGRRRVADGGRERFGQIKHRSCEAQNFGEYVGFIWNVADLLRGPYKPNQYGRVILPLLVLRRLDCVLEPTKDKVLHKAAELKGQSEPSQIAGLQSGILPDLGEVPHIHGGPWWRARRSCEARKRPSSSTSISIARGSISIMAHSLGLPDYKPVSVRRLSAAGKSGRQSFVLAGDLSPAPATYPEVVTERDRSSSPIWSCSAWGLPCRRALLRPRCALTAPFHPYPPGNPRRAVLFSVALSVKLALSESPRPLAGMPPYGDRTFLPSR